jgi:hypothetical protein
MRFILRLCVAVAVVVACGAYFSLTQRASAQTKVLPGQVIISELRMRGPGTGQTPNPDEDEFVEIYNNTDQPISVQAVDASGGWGVTAEDGIVRCIIPNGTTIPARGHFLCANTDGYSLGGYPSGNPTTIIAVNPPAPERAPVRRPPTRTTLSVRSAQPQAIVAPSPSPFTTATPDAAFSDTDPDTGGVQGLDIPDGSGVALFLSASPANQNERTRLDAFGFTGSPALYKEGNGFAIVPRANSQMTLFRNQSTGIGLPKDTNDNAADFLLAATDVPNISISLLGAPGPENLSSPVFHNNDIGASLLDPSRVASEPPNRERRPNVVTNGQLGTLLVRRTFTNNTGQPVTRLRFRITNLTTRGAENQCSAGVCSDLRALTSQDGESSIGTQVVAVRGVRLEEPPEQPQGGGWNSSLSADFISLNTPLAPGASVNIQFMFGVMRIGPFRVLLDIEAQTAATPILAAPVQ